MTYRPSEKACLFHFIGARYRIRCWDTRHTTAKINAIIGYVGLEDDKKHVRYKLVEHVFNVCGLDDIHSTSRFMPVRLSI